MTTTTAATRTTDFAGLPVEGDIIYGDEQDEQRPVEEFYALLLEVLADDDVKAVHWTQYTPYFNDGEPCTFGTGEVTVTLHSQPDPDNGPYERGYGCYTPQIKGGHRREYDSANRRWVDVGEALPPHPVLPVLSAFTRCFGAHQVSLLKAFGDHAEVHVSRDGIKVDRYEHE